MTKRSKVVLLIIGSIIIIAHLLGFKIFGKAVLVKNQPLKNPQKMADLTKQGSIVLENGKEYAIYGIITILPKPLEQLRYFKFQMPTIEIEVESPEQTVSRVWVKNRFNYWCGNTWMPQFFPPRLPAFAKVDLGEIMVREGGAIPSISVFEQSPEYAQKLMKALSPKVSELAIEQNSEFAVRLGEYLLVSLPEYFREGVWLLARNGKQEIFPAVTQKIYESINEFEKRQTDVSFDPPRARENIIDFAYILMKLNEDKAKKLLLEYIQKDIDAYLRVHMANVLLSVNDPCGYDILMDKMMEPKVDEYVKASLMHEMDRFLSNSTPGEHYPSEDAQMMYIWYQQNRKLLHWDKKKWEMSISKEL